MTFYFRLVFGMTFFAAFHNAALAGGNLTHGQNLYQNLCISCHSFEYNGVGPTHKNLLGRKAGSLTDYVYSPALASSGIVWSAATLDKWLRNPEKLVPGQKMGFMVPSAQDRADLIVYLKSGTLSSSTPP